MSVPIETTAAMTAPGDTDSAVTAETAAPEPQGSMPPTGAAHLEGLVAERRAVSPNAVIGVMGGLIAALIGGMFVLLVWQFGALNDSIDNLGARIDNQGAELRAEMDMLRTDLRSELRSEIGTLRGEMQAGFRSINDALLDHTDRLARLEAAVLNPSAEP